MRKGRHHCTFAITTSRVTQYGRPKKSNRDKKFVSSILAIANTQIPAEKLPKINRNQGEKANFLHEILALQFTSTDNLSSIFLHCNTSSTWCASPLLQTYAKHKTLDDKQWSILVKRRFLKIKTRENSQRAMPQRMDVLTCVNRCKQVAIQFADWGTIYRLKNEGRHESRKRWHSVGWKTWTGPKVLRLWDFPLSTFVGDRERRMTNDWMSDRSGGGGGGCGCGCCCCCRLTVIDGKTTDAEMVRRFRWWRWWWNVRPLITGRRSCVCMCGATSNGPTTTTT